MQRPPMGRLERLCITILFRSYDFDDCLRLDLSATL